MLEQLIHAHFTEKLLERAAEALRHYFRIEIEGLENIPKSGPAVIAPNHSGFLATDALMIAHMLHRDLGRIPRLMAHRAFFEWFETLRRVSTAFGLEEVSVDRGIELLKEKELVLIFPEGEAGNFKSTLKRYRLQEFHSGFVRMALNARAPIVPCLVVGAEESHLNLGSFDLGRLMRGLRVPVPVNLVPLPAKWKIRFLPPIEVVPHCVSENGDMDWTKVQKMCSRIRVRMQREIRLEIRKRSFVYFDRTPDPHFGEPV